MKKIICLIVGCISLALGAAGSMIPMLPTVPFLMLAAFSFARSSEKLHTWFVDTKLYKDNLEDYVAGRGMTQKTKLRITLTVTLLMAFGFTVMAMNGVVVGCIILGCVWAVHIAYFIWGVKTIETANKETTTV